MAREILVLERSPQKGEANLIFRYPIPEADRKTYVDAQGVTRAVVPTPSAGLPDVAKALYTPAELATFDAGEAFWRPFKVNIEGLSASQAAAKVREVYAANEAEYRPEYARRYSHIGTFINAV